MSKAEKTKEFIIEKAAPVFNIKGYAGTSITDLMLATGLTKGSIYGNFENKDEVAIAVYNYHVNRLNNQINDFLLPKKSMIDKLIGITDYYRNNWKSICERGGCPILNTSVEADDNMPALKKLVQQSINNWALTIARVIEKGMERGEIKPTVVAIDYGYTIISMLEGGIMLTKIMNSHKHIHAALDRILAMINTELKK